MNLNQLQKWFEFFLLRCRRRLEKFRLVQVAQGCAFWFNLLLRFGSSLFCDLHLVFDFVGLFKILILLKKIELVHQNDCKTTFCPPEQIQVITHIKHIPLLKIKSFLQQKYVEEGLTVNQIVALTMSSRSTVKKYLRQAQIPIRADDCRLGSLSYGERKVKGRIIPNQNELELIEKIMGLKQKGLNPQQIADLLAGLKLPTKRGGKWSRKVVHTILKRMEPK